MSAVGHYLEQEGIPSASISLVREHSEVMAPPRALWVPFMLGRPLGAPDEPAFQRQVLRALLALFDADEGSVLRDFPHDAPSAAPGDQPDGAACPVNFARPRPTAMDGTDMTARLIEELDTLRPWHDLSVRRRGGTAVGVSGLTPDQAATFLCAFADGRPVDNFRPAQPLAMSVKQACDDLRTYHEEAAAAQPGGLEPGQMQAWFYLHTVAGLVVHAVRIRGMSDADSTMRALTERTLIPRSILNRSQPT